MDNNLKWVNDEKILRTIKGKIKGKLFNNGMYKMGIYGSPMVFDSVYLTEKEDVENISLG